MWTVMKITAVLAMAAALAYGQAPASSVAGPRLLFSSSAAVSGSTGAAGEILREIDDPHNGDRWLLVRDDSHPGGPGRLLLVSAVRVQARAAGLEVKTETQAPIIRGGEKVIVEQNTAVVEARLEAVAMGPAWAGSSFNVRLTIGGRVVRAIAAGQGRGILQEEAQR